MHPLLSIRYEKLTVFHLSFQASQNESTKSNIFLEYLLKFQTLDKKPLLSNLHNIHIDQLVTNVKECFIMCSHNDCHAIIV